LAGAGDPVQEARELLAKDEEERAEPSEEEDRKRSALAADLVALHPSLRVEPSDNGFSYGCSFETDDPECPVPYIYVRIGTGSVSFSYSADPKVAFREAFRAIAVFERHGYAAYDPQTESMLSSSQSAEPGESSFRATRDAVVQQMRDRGEIVLGYPAPKKGSLLVPGLIVFVIVAIALVLIRQHYRVERSPETVKALRDAQDRLHPPRQAPSDRRDTEKPSR
jgi:hypothetical protein